MARWRLGLGVALLMPLLPAPAYAACSAPIVNSSPPLASCASPATAYSVTVATGGVHWVVGCAGAVFNSGTIWAPGNAAGAIPGGCPTANITLRPLVAGTNAVGQLT